MSRKRPIILAANLSFAAVLAAAAPPNSVTPLALYQGSWSVIRDGAVAGTKPEQLRNDCAALGKYFACQQTVNGSVVGLLVFISTGEPGHYYTQTLLPEGRATGRDEMEISGNQWIFTSSRRDGSKTTYYRTVNAFSGKSRIHFERDESTDGKQWVKTGSGDETKMMDDHAK